MENIIELCKIGDLEGIIQLEKELDIYINDIYNENIENYVNKTPFVIALIHGHLHIVKYFISSGYNTDLLHNSNIIHDVISNENNLNKEQLIAIFNYLINELHIDINKRDMIGNTFLHYAITHNKIISANILLNMGINKYNQNQYSEVAFDLATNDLLEQINNKYVEDYLHI